MFITPFNNFELIYDIYLTYFIESVFLLNVIIGSAKSLLIWLKKFSNETFLYMIDYFILMVFFFTFMI